MTRWLLASALLVLTGCRCEGPLTPVEPARLEATPQRLILSPVYVGQSRSAVVSIVNHGGAREVAAVSADTPFTVDHAVLALSKGETGNLSVRFLGLTPGTVTGLLHVGDLTVPVEAECLALPQCLPSDVCRSTHFDEGTSQCVETPKAEGLPCETSCLTGSCASGTCVGQLKDCPDDGDACTLEACDDSSGCTHNPVTCPAPTAPCLVARCDAATGCGTEVATDGTLCGPDNCSATDVDVCIAGTCVKRMRPDEGRCANRWVPDRIPSRSHLAMAYDAARGRVVVFGGWTGEGQLSDTWEWDGTHWTQRTPAASPPATGGHALAYDAARQRVLFLGGLGQATWEWDGTTWTQRTPAAPFPSVDYAMTYDGARHRVLLFGGWSGSVALSDTWEWDGATWLRRTPASAPPARRGHAMAFDAARGRVVLFGGFDGTASLSDTWEWDGVTWTRRTPATSPSARWDHDLAYDAARQRVVLFGGGPGLSDTWEWDGTTWLQRTPVTAPPRRQNHSLAYDLTRRRVVLFGGTDHSQGTHFSDTWEWDGTHWTEHARGKPAPASPSGDALATDSARQTVLYFGSWQAQTWEWDGADWAQRTPVTRPTSRQLFALAADPGRARVVLFGGTVPDSSDFSDTWEWDGTTWAERLPATSPPGRIAHAMASDEARQRVLLFGGGHLNDTWEWDGSTWTQRTPALSPSARDQHAMAYDSARQVVVLFGGTGLASQLADTWEWDGTNWAQRTPLASPPARQGHTMAFDPARQRLVLFGGWTDSSTSSIGLADTWEWDGVSWTKRTPATSPRPGMGHSMAYDPRRQRVVMFDGDTLWTLLP